MSSSAPAIEVAKRAIECWGLEGACTKLTVALALVLRAKYGEGEEFNEQAEMIGPLLKLSPTKLPEAMEPIP